MQRDKEKKKLKKGEVLAGWIIIALIFVISIANIALPDRDFSEKENRMLDQKPEMSAASLFDG